MSIFTLEKKRRKLLSPWADTKAADLYKKNRPGMISGAVLLRFGCNEGFYPIFQKDNSRIALAKFVDMR